MSKLARQFEYNISKNVAFAPSSALPELCPEEYPVRYIAYYLPQFHEIPENNEWWGAGFTEWTNVTKALPRYAGHYQPRLPGDLGFYDLSNVDHIRRQVALAKRGGIYGFCIHNYWFSGYCLLETPIRIILENKDIDIPFCINWANESWTRRWDGSESVILREQRYAPGEDLQYADYISEFIEDPRYIRVGGRPLIMIYRPGHLPDAKATVERWRDFFFQKGLGNPYIIMPQAFGDDDPRKYSMDAAAGFPPHKVGFRVAPNIHRCLEFLDWNFIGTVAPYDAIVANALANITNEFRLFPGVCPTWDNEARRPNESFSLFGSTPEKYASWLAAATSTAIQAPAVDERLVFINAWNEWAEGAYLEPDRHFGFAYLAQTRYVLDSLAGTLPVTSGPASLGRDPSPFETPEPGYFNFIRNVPRLILRRIMRTLRKDSNRSTTTAA